MSSKEWRQLKPEEQNSVAAFQAEMPVKLSGLAKRFGLRIVASTLPVGISGEIRPDGASGFVINVNRHDSQRRQRFTVAHEISHYLLHRDQIGSGIRDDVLYRSSLSDSREAEANRLAADILMPLDMVRRKLAERGGALDETTVAALSEEFGVSDVAMRIRLGID